MRDLLASVFTRKYLTGLAIVIILVAAVYGLWYWDTQKDRERSRQEFRQAEEEWAEAEKRAKTAEAPSVSATPSAITYSTTETTVTKDSPEYKCACINAGCEVELSDDLVANFGYVFDSLMAKFPGYTRLNIANIVCAAKERIDTSTIAKKSLLEVAHEINNSVPIEAAGVVSLEEVAAAYVGLLRQYGQ